MELRQYVRVLRTRWRLIALTMLVCTAAAALLAWTRDPMYEANTQLFVSSAGAPADQSQTYQGGLFSQQRVRSYAKIVSTPPVVQAVVGELGLSRSVRDLQDEISASVPTDTVLIDVAVRDRSPAQAAAIANSVGKQFPKFITSIETPERGQGSPVKVSVTSPAEVPSGAVSPKKPLYLLLGAFLGLLLGTGGAFLREALDNRVREGRDAATIVAAPVLGRIERYRDSAKRPLVMTSNPASPAAEAFRALRTAVRAVGIEQGMRSFVVSSALPSEGKTSVVANLGVAFGQAGNRVIVVDGDLRAPKLGAVLGVDSSRGLSDVLADDVPVESVLQRYDALPLEVLPSGGLPVNPSELLGSPRFERLLRTLTERADIVLIDTPALLPVTDGTVLARLASAVIFVTRVSSTRTDQLELAVQSLRAAVDKDILGVVLNGSESRDGYGHGHYGLDRAETT